MTRYGNRSQRQANAEWALEADDIYWDTYRMNPTPEETFEEELEHRARFGYVPSELLEVTEDLAA